MSENVLLVELRPSTWIIPPTVSTEVLMKWAKLGWINKEDAEHLDRAFYRDNEGRPILTEHQFRSCINKAIERMLDLEAGTDYYEQITELQREALAESNKERRKEIEEEIRQIVKERDVKFGVLLRQLRKNVRFRLVDFAVADNKVRKLQIGYIVIFDPPDKTRVPVTTPDGIRSSEYIEYLHSAHKLLFWVEAKNPTAFMNILTLAGRDVGFGARTSRGFGRFSVRALDYDSPKPLEEVWKELSDGEKEENKRCKGGKK